MSFFFFFFYYIAVSICHKPDETLDMMMALGEITKVTTNLLLLLMTSHTIL